MVKEARRPDRKEADRRDSTKPGTIVAGPDAHARERSGTAPSERHDRQKGNPPSDPAND
jgi:hypothetical protein